MEQQKFKKAKTEKKNTITKKGENKNPHCTKTGKGQNYETGRTQKRLPGVMLFAEMKEPVTEGLCPYHKKCGGCSYLGLSYEEQLAKKELWIKKLLKDYVKMDSIIETENPFHYRHKVHAVFGEDRKHNIISGTYEEKSHKIVSVDSCLLDNEVSDRIIVSIRELMKSFKYKPFNEDTGYGLVRHVMIRSGYHSGEVMVIMVLTSPILPSKNRFVKALLKQHPEITTIVANVNDRNTSMVLGTRDIVLYGKGYITDSLCGKNFRISPQSFYQVNPYQTEKLYHKAVEFAGLTGKERVLDAYCGTGTIGLIASDMAKEVIGVELNKKAVADARRNARENGVNNITFFAEDAGEFMVKMADRQEKVDVVFMDPPRGGSSEAFLKSVALLKPGKVVYVSCNPETLARDLKVLVKSGYQVKRAVGVDLFPWTEHVETVVLLSRNK